MKKVIFVVVLSVFIMATSGVTYAQEKTSMMGEEKKGKMKGKDAKHHMMMKKKMAKQMVATGDGGVIVLIGNRLVKYDKDLNLVKEVEIKMDMEAMMEKCREMMKECGMGKESE